MKRIRVAGIIVILALMVTGAIVWRNAGVVPAEELAATVGPNLDGPVDAPVRIVEFGDFGCPSCRAWHNAGIRQQVRTAFGEQVAFEFRHFPVITAQSPKAAEAAQCASEQGAFWEYHDFVYERTPQGALSVADLKSYAAELGLSQSTFEDCLDSGRFQQFVTRDMQAAFEAGARGTPSFFIGGEPISFSFEGMSAAIQQALDS
jgi:protein-disulfide isomerase